MPRLAQTLHGYDQGHRLLASTEGLLDARELALLDRLSDLSGYLPSGTSFDRYHTGFPCGRYYALACTWPDASAARAGTVLTHTLLLPRSEARGLNDLWALAAHHQQPASAAGWATYTQPLEVALAEQPVDHGLSPDELAGLVALAFGQSQRPLLWVDSRRPEGVVRSLWHLLWPEQRERFAFCTLALQLRTVEGTLFDFLGLPPEARGAFLQYAGSEAWWDTGRIVHARVAGLLQQPWAQDIRRGGAAVTHRLVDWCHTSRLPPPEPWELPVLWRFLDLEPAATERLTAARARADLFEKLWPQAEPTHPIAVRVLDDLLARQPEAALKPKPLWELVDLLKRSLLRRRCQAEPAFASRVDELRAAELLKRLSQEPARSAEELPELIEASDTVPWGPRSVEAIQQAVRQAAHPLPLAKHLLLTAATRDWIDIAEAALTPLNEATRTRLLSEALLTESAPRAQLLSLLSRISEKLRDPTLTLEAALLRGEAVEGLHAAMRLLLQRASPLQLTSVDALLQKVDTSAHLEWALTETDSRLAPYVEKIIGQELLQQNLSPSEVVGFCEGRPNGPRVLSAWLQALARSNETGQQLRASPAHARDLLLLMLREDGLPYDESLARTAIDVLPAELLLTADVPEILLKSKKQPQVRTLISLLAPYWLQRVAETPPPYEDLAHWLDLPLLRDWLGYASSHQLSRALGAGTRGQALPRLTGVIGTWLRRSESREVHWIISLLPFFLDSASALELEDATADLVHILGQVLPHYDGDRLALQVLEAVSSKQPLSGWRLVELSFPRVYPQLLRNAPSWIGQFVRDITALFIGSHNDNWDLAKRLRWWLLDTYIVLNWPPVSFLRCMGGDEKLFQRLVFRAAKTHQGRDFLHKLPQALASEPELERRWRYAVKEALANPLHPVDYE
jgi:hypothetical protein